MRYYFTACLFLIALILTISEVSAQNQSEADSLIQVYESGKYADEMALLKKIAQSAIDPEIQIEYAEILLKKAKSKSQTNYILTGYSQLGNALQVKGEFLDALDSYIRAIDLSNSVNDDIITARLFISVADTYSMIGDSENAKKYYTEGIEKMRISDDSTSLGRALLNFGEEYFFAHEYETALKHYKESARIFEKLDYDYGLAYTMGNEGMVYAAQGKDDLALRYINDAIAILEEWQDYYPISVYLLDMAALFAENGDYDEAFNYAQRSLSLATQYNLKDQISDANLKLSELFEKVGQKGSAYDYYKNHILYRDSFTNIENVRNIAKLSTAFEVSQKQIEVDLLNEQQRTQKVILYASIIALILIGILALGLFRRNLFIRRTNVVIEREKIRSDHLLKNILPAETAKELKEHGRVKAKRFDTVSVLFTDFKGFTLHAEHLSPEDLLSSLDYYFTYFDKLMDDYGIEKIKTLGDSYMCAAGLPFEVEDHALRMTHVALKMLQFVEEAKVTNPDNKTRFDIRIGISSGPLVAGVVGNKKFAYDIWGDTVNIASRMESYSEAGKINISEDTYELVKDTFKCVYRGEVDVKNKGNMKMFYVEGPLVSQEPTEIEDVVNVGKS